MARTNPTAHTASRHCISSLRVLRAAHRSVLASAETSSGDFLGGLKRFGKTVQGGLPIVGLISRLTSPQGGFDELSYPEFCRTWLESGSERLNFSIADFQAKYGRQAGRRPVFLLVWMVQKACGTLPGKYFVLSARRLHASMDVEAEMGRFEQSLDLENSKYSIVEAPKAPLETQIETAVDCLATCSLGLRDEQPISDEDQGFLKDILAVLFEEANEDVIAEALSTKANRKYD